MIPRGLPLLLFEFALRVHRGELTPAEAAQKFVEMDAASAPGSAPEAAPAARGGDGDRGTDDLG